MKILSRIKSGWHTLLHKLGLVTKAEEAAAVEKAKKVSRKKVVEMAEKIVKKQMEVRRGMREDAKEAMKVKKKYKPTADEMEAAGYD